MGCLVFIWSLSPFSAPFLYSSAVNVLAGDGSNFPISYEC